MQCRSMVSGCCTGSSMLLRYDPGELDVYKQYAPRGSTVIDIGANLGASAGQVLDILEHS